MRAPHLSCLLFGALLATTGCPDATDDDDSAAAVDDDDDDGGCGLASGGAGGAMDTLRWFGPDGGPGSPGDGTSEYEMLVYAPSSAPTPMPVLLLVGRRMPLAHGENETIFTQLGMTDFADTYGYLVALPNPGDTGNSQINWTDSETDAAFFDDAMDVLESQYDIDVDRVHAVGSSAGGRAATYLGWAHADRLASIVNHAGSSPFGTWPETPWANECAGLFIHDDDDPIVPRSAIEAVVAEWEAAGQVTETYYDYPNEHEWRPEALFPAMTEFFDGVCNDR